MSETCTVVVADFAWFSQVCHEPAVSTIRQDGIEWPVCAEHLAAATGGGP